MVEQLPVKQKVVGPNPAAGVKKGDSMYKAPAYKEIVQTTWGQYENVHLGEFRVKILTILPGQRLVLQRHVEREEHYYVVRGCAKIIGDGESYRLYPTDSINIEKNEWYRVTNDYQVNLVIVEIQTGICYEEDIQENES
jgi:mannose-6-phosphate isomerase-like protein (cupin superfamily)